MSRMLFGLAVGLLTFTGSAWADGPIVRWDRIEGVLPPTESQPMVIGNQANKLQSHPGQFSVGKGKAMVNLETGFVSFQVDRLAFAYTSTNPIGGIPESSIDVIGTVVCNAGRDTGDWIIDFVDTERVSLRFGTGSFQGFVAIPPLCLQEPLQIAFLIRWPLDFYINPGRFTAYGAGRTLQ